VADHCPDGDWAGDWRSFGVFWGLPAAVMVAAALLDPALRGAVWTAMLLWMGGACVANARRCGRTHCRFTGPFLLLMAGLVAGHALGLLPLGGNGWSLLAAAIVLGSGVLWLASEQIWGRFSR
jgi:hypothetical protein